MSWMYSTWCYASKTARMPVKKIPSKVPAPPIDATGAPSASLRGGVQVNFSLRVLYIIRDTVSQRKLYGRRAVGPQCRSQPSEASRGAEPVPATAWREGGRLCEYDPED